MVYEAVVRIPRYLPVVEDLGEIKIRDYKNTRYKNILNYR